MCENLQIYIANMLITCRHTYISYIIYVKHMLKKYEKSLEKNINKLLNTDTVALEIYNMLTYVCSGNGMCTYPHAYK